MSLRLVLWMSVVVLVALLLAELLLQPPTGGERLHLAMILVIPACVTTALLPVVRRWVSTRASVAGAALVVGLCSLTLGAVTTSAASNAMFLSSHDYRLFLVVLLLSCGLALVVGTQLTRPLATDISRLGKVADRVANGDLNIRTGIERSDEVGRTARAVDQMVAALETAEQERQRATIARQHLFTSVGHDLRTPLAAMRAAVESLQDGVAPDPDRYLANLSTQLDELESLLDQFVEYARIESGQPGAARTTVSVTEIAHEAIEAMTPLADRREVALAIDASAPASVEGSAIELSRVIRNLVENAIRHSPPGSTARVVISDGDGVTLTISDEGPGFPPDFRGHAFEPFTRADPARNNRSGHAGLGLAISRALVESHGGRIWLGPGPGGDVSVWLPAHRP
jgi:signal transduction histidine kinase